MKTKNYVYSVMLYTYIFFYIICNYYIHMHLQSLWMFFPASSINTSLFNISIDDLHCVRDWLYNFRIPNIIFNVIAIVSGDKQFAVNMTCTVLVSFCIWLIYKIVYIQTKNKYAAFFAAFVFSTLPVTVFHLKIITTRLPETTYMLLIIYFYLKSDDFFITKYAMLCFVTLLAILSGGKSILMYVVIFFTGSTYFLYEKKKCFTRLYMYNLLLLPVILNVLFTKRFGDYCTSKLPVWLFLDNLNLGVLYRLLSEFVRNFYYILSNYYAFLVILVIGISFCLQYLFLKKSKSSTEKIIEFLIFIPFVVHFLTSLETTPELLSKYAIEKTVMIDIIPAFAFLCVKIGLLIPYIYSFIQTKLKTGKLYFLSKVVMFSSVVVLSIYTFFYGLSMLPIYVPVFLEKTYSLLQIKRRNFDFTDSFKADRLYIDFQEYVSFHTKVFPSKKILIILSPYLLHLSRDALSLDISQKDIDIIGHFNSKNDIENYINYSDKKNIFICSQDETSKSMEFSKFLIDVFCENISGFSLRKKIIVSDDFGSIWIYW